MLYNFTTPGGTLQHIKESNDLIEHLHKLKATIFPDMVCPARTS